MKWITDQSALRFISIPLFFWKLKKMYPITLVARKYSDSTSHNFDIYLPEWLAKYNKLIYTGIVIIAVIILCIQLYCN